MKLDITRHALSVWGVPAVVAAALVLVAAAADLEENLARLKLLPRDQRAKLVENLQKFDLVLTAEQRKSLRELDRRIAELPPDQQADYLAALRRYHNWLNRLPDRNRDEILSTPAEKRMALVAKLVSQHPSPRADTPRFLRIADPGQYSPFELAAIYKIWQALTPAERQELERVPPGPNRREELLNLSDAKDIPREIRPDDFNEKRWTTRLEEHWKKGRALLPGDELKKKQPRWLEITRRQAINLYYLAQPPAPVTSERLQQFVAGFPDWVEASFDSYPPDEARRRLAVVYRLVFPRGTEIKPAAAPAGTPSGAAKRQPEGRPPGPSGRSSGPAKSSTPF
jgi:hypothetical protein